jgi:uncharacterized Zn finger protein
MPTPQNKHTMEFVIESASSGAEYRIQVWDEPTGPVITCDCPAGQKGTQCKHRIALISGDGGDVIRSTHPAADLAKLCEGTAIARALQDIHDQERAVKAAQASLKKSRKVLADAMLGRT